MQFNVLFLNYNAPLACVVAVTRCDTPGTMPGKLHPGSVGQRGGGCGVRCGQAPPLAPVVPSAPPCLPTGDPQAHARREAALPGAALERATTARRMRDRHPHPGLGGHSPASLGTPSTRSSRHPPEVRDPTSRRCGLNDEYVDGPSGRGWDMGSAPCVFRRVRTGVERVLTHRAGLRSDPGWGGLLTQLSSTFCPKWALRL